MSKIEKYMRQYNERNYAFKERKLEKRDLVKYINRSECRQTAEASCGDSDEQSRKIKEEIEVKNEEVRKEDVGQTYQQGRQGISKSNQGRCKIEESHPCKTKGKEMKKEKAKHIKHEAKESKAYEKKEDKKESKVKKK